MASSTPTPAAIDAEPRDDYLDVFEHIPDRDGRTYDSVADAELDDSLTAAIEAAEAADNEWLARMLSYHLGSHYLSNGQ